MTILTTALVGSERHEIVEADAVYAVHYRGRPFNYRVVKANGVQPVKYRKAFFTTLGHAHLMADRLNERFSTDQFTVRMME